MESDVAQLPHLRRALRWDPEVKFLIFNCGSSSLAYKVIEATRPDGLKILVSGKAHRVGTKGMEPAFLEHHVGNQVLKITQPLENHRVAAADVLAFLQCKDIRFDCIGHRFVRAGAFFTQSALLDVDTLRKLDLCVNLAPIHNPVSLAVIRECSHAFPAMPQFVAFDTVFHASIPAYAFSYALPHALIERFGFRQFGFHELSYSYVVREASCYLSTPLNEFTAVICHLGTGGSSVAAIRNGRSVDGSMGYSPLAGLVMSTRCGDIDPMLPFHLMATYGIGAEQLIELLNYQSGLYGLSGISSDIRDLLSRLDEGKAKLAVDTYVHRLIKYVGAFAVVLGGMRALVFTDDVGVGCPVVRERVCRNMQWCGVVLDSELNRSADPTRISPLNGPESAVRVLSVPNDEEASIALEGLRLLGASR